MFEEFDRKNGAMPLNADQAKFKQLVLDALQSLCKPLKKVTMIGYTGPGYYYQDYVVTLVATRDRESCDLYRNRDGALVFSMRNLGVTAMGYEYIFVDSHLDRKIKEKDGKAKGN